MIVKSIYEQIEDFRYGYLILTESQFLDVCRKFPDKNIKFDKFPYMKNYAIFGWRECKIMIFSTESLIKKTFPLIKSYYDLSFLDPYKTDDMSLILQSDKVSPNMKNDEIEQMYSIGHIWLAYVYITKSGKKRMCFNSNLLGRNKLISSRTMNLREILVDL